MEIVFCLVVLYAIIGSFTAAENLTGKHLLGVRRGGLRVAVRAALESAAWPVVMLPWRELPSVLRRTWHALPIRYSEVAA